MTVPVIPIFLRIKPKVVMQPLRSYTLHSTSPLQPIHYSPLSPSFCCSHPGPSAVSQTRSPSTSEPSHLRVTAIRCHLPPLPSHSRFLPLFSVSSYHLLPPDIRFTCFSICLFSNISYRTAGILCCNRI